MTALFVDAGDPHYRDENGSGDPTWAVAVATGGGRLIARRFVVARSNMVAERMAIDLGLEVVASVGASRLCSDVRSLVNAANGAGPRALHSSATRLREYVEWAERVRAALEASAVTLEWCPRQVNTAHRWARRQRFEA